MSHMLSAGSESDGEEASGLPAGGQRPQVSFLTAVLMAVALTFHSLLEVRMPAALDGVPMCMLWCIDLLNNMLC